MENFENFTNYDLNKSNYLEISDIRNKLTPITNLISMLETSSVIYHENPKVNQLILKEIEQVKKSINYLAQRNIYFIKKLKL